MGRLALPLATLALAHVGDLARRSSFCGTLVTGGETRGGEQSKRSPSDYRGRR